MRTIFLPEINSNTLTQGFSIKGDDAFHLERVVRVQRGDALQITNGKGLSLICSIVEIKKNEVSLQVENTFEIPKTHSISLLCGKPKKSTCEEIIRLGVELGLEKIYFWESEFSQSSSFAPERLNSIIKNAMEQSNNYWQPNLNFISVLSKNFFADFDDVILFHNRHQEKSEKQYTHAGKKLLFVVGPEGGLSANDITQITNFTNNCVMASLPTPIMTTPTAISCGFGYLINGVN